MIPRLNAIKLPQDITNIRWVLSCGLNAIGSGHRFGPDQKGCPCESIESAGNNPIKSRIL